LIEINDAENDGRLAASIAGQTGQRRLTEYGRRRRCFSSWKLQSPSEYIS
jgi:hypothetical protein